MTLLTQNIENSFQQKMKTGCLCRPNQDFQLSMEEGSSLQAPMEESLQQHVLMDPELLVPEISMSQA